MNSEDTCIGLAETWQVLVFAWTHYYGIKYRISSKIWIFFFQFNFLSQIIWWLNQSELQTTKVFRCGVLAYLFPIFYYFLVFDLENHLSIADNFMIVFEKMIAFKLQKNTIDALPSSSLVGVRFCRSNVFFKKGNEVQDYFEKWNVSL